MQRIDVLLQKISNLSKLNDKATIIDIDLMLDYTRVMYADLLEMKSRMSFNESLVLNDTTEKPQIQVQPVITTPDTVTKKDIQNSIGINDKYQFISELFSNNKELYDNVIAELNTFDNYTQAYNWLHANVPTANSWEDENPVVQSFLSVLQQFYK
ncbi:MAG: hypothetical protein JST82_04745 [Bacteroidetes bacterium]|nr:hypothetical protein [Bacteroidota bacterium]